MKIARTGNNKKDQTVKDHLLNVANISKENGVKVGLEQTSFLAGILHDMGKLTDSFQSYIKSNINEDGKSSSKVDHAVYGAKYIYSKASDEGYEKITAEIIAMIICYHHGGLPDYIDSNFDISILKRMEKLSDEVYEQLFFEFEEMFSEYNFNNLFKQSVIEIKQFIEKVNKDKYKDDKSKLFSYHMLIKTLYSILIDSDWYDSYLYESNNKYKKQDVLNHYIKDYIFNIKQRMNSFKLTKATSTLQQTVFNIRNKVADDCLNFAEKDTGIYTLTLPTGGGKTLSSLNFALHHSQHHNKDRIFYIAPYTSIIEQNSKEIRKTLNCGDKLLEYHSNVITESIVNNDYEDEKNIKILSSRWDYPIVFTTMVQFLNSIFASPSQDIRKLQSLINSVIIIDEAQAVPLHCTTLFNEAINFLSEFLNCTIVLSTATQPALNDIKRPINFSNNSEIVNDVKSAYKGLKRVNVVDKTKPGGYSYEESINFLMELKKENRSVLMVVNTIKTAEELFKLLKTNNLNIKTYYLSSNICPKHRLKILDSIKQSLEEKDDVICISTQVIECGVDISFNTVIRSVTGLDSIAQAFGRCNRHGEETIANSYIINYNNDYENTSKILNIDIGKKQTTNVLELYKNNCERYSNDLLSPESINEYFKRFISDNKIAEELDYIIKKEKTTIFELLTSTNNIRSYQYIKNLKYPLIFSFPFRMAKDNFEVINCSTKTIIVPYENGESLINDLISSIDITEKYSLLKQAQLYTVNVYNNKFNDLNKLEAFLPCDLEGVYLLKDGFYNNDLGIILEKNMELCSH